MAEPAAHETVLDVTAEQIARTYAQGFLGATGDGAGEAVEDLRAVVDEVLGTHADFASALHSAFIDHPTRVQMIDRVLGGRVGPAVLNLLKVLSSHERLSLVGEVASQAKRLYDRSLGRAPVTVRVAHAIDDDTLRQVENAVRAKMGVEPVVTVEVAPELVGGLEIRVGDTVFDGTVRTAFAKAHEAIVHQTVDAIESQPERFTLND